MSRWDWVFPRRGGEVDVHLGDPKKAFQRVLRDTGITGNSTHLRQRSHRSRVMAAHPARGASWLLSVHSNSEENWMPKGTPTHRKGRDVYVSVSGQRGGGRLLLAASTARPSEPNGPNFRLAGTVTS